MRVVIEGADGKIWCGDAWSFMQRDLQERYPTFRLTKKDARTHFAELAEQLLAERHKLDEDI